MSTMEQAKALKEQMVNDRRWFHKHPELGLNTVETAEYVENRLKDMGYAPYRIGKNGIVADLVIKEGAKTIMLRADIDALPIKENTDLDYAADNGNMHACGHDMHAASLLGAAQLIMDNKDKLAGNVKLMFQPAEETFEGGKDMIDNGLLTTGLKPDLAFATHVNSEIPTNVIVSKPETMMASSDNFLITVHGSGGHGSMPQQCIDSINIAIHIHLAFQELMSREVGISDRAVLTIGSFQGGDAANIFPEITTMRGTLRTFDEEVRKKVLARMEEIVPAVAKVYRGTADIEFVAKTPCTYNNPELYPEVIEIIKSVDPSIQFVNFPGDGAAGSEDFAYVSQEIPSVYVAVGARDPKIETAYPQHHEKVTFDDDALVVAAATFYDVAEKMLAK